MKIERFLIWIQEKMLNYPDIDAKTLKMFIQEFNKCLSKNERERWWILIQTINEITSKQITIESFILQDNIKKLDDQLNKLKKEVKPK